ncbi:MAG: DUF4402 domain-containing protein [Gammaproteobacteria bacterium]|nr:DUF4402 domain-containing protein [Gammaproteobacteria bacterium]
MVVEDQRLDFGTFAIISNNAVSTLAVEATGHSVATGAIRLIEPGEPGIYRLLDYPPGQVLTISVNAGLMTIPGVSSGPVMAISQFYYPAVVIADINGDAQLVVGGMLQTSGDGQSYYDADYRSVLNIIISY